MAEKGKFSLNFSQYDVRKQIRTRNSQDWKVYAITYRKG